MLPASDGLLGLVRRVLHDGAQSEEVTQEVPEPPANSIYLAWMLSVSGRPRSAGWSRAVVRRPVFRLLTG